MPYIIQTNNLTKSIGGRQLVTDINLHVKKGEIYGFLGPNGAGKTTVMKMITNLWKPTKGTVEVLGEQLRNNSYGVLKRMGSIIEFPVFYESLSGEDNLKLHCEYMGFYQKGSVENSLKMLDLTDAAKKPVKEYSLGMKQRLGIARAILAGPELLVLYEPTNGLDPAGMKQIRELLRMLKEEYNTTILISSHLLPEIEHIADTVGVISRGRMQREVSMKDIAEKNLAYIEISVKNVKRAAYILADSIKLQNFKVLDEQKIRVYEPTASTGELSKALALGGVEVEAIGRQSESLEDYFLKVTEGEDNMDLLNLVKLEYRKNNISKYVRNAVILAFLLTVFILALAFLGIANDPDTGKLDAAPGNNVLSAPVELFTSMAFLIFTSVMLSSFIVSAYKNKTMNLMFTYPIKRQKILASQMLAVWIFNFAALTLTKLVIYLCAAVGAHFRETSFLLDYNIGSVTFYVQLLVKSAVIVSMSFIALFIGLAMKSSKAAIVTHFYSYSLHRLMWVIIRWRTVQCFLRF